MFDVGATELVLVAVIGLVVVGPERLPRLARTVGLWVKRLRGQVQTIQNDINRELELEDLKRQLEERKGGLKMEDIAGEDSLGLSQTSNTSKAEKNERSKPE